MLRLLCTLGTIASTAVAVWSEVCTAEFTRLITSAAASPLRSASLRTSEATTANPLPCSPARAASTAALSARIFVWLAISPTTLIFAAISCTALRLLLTFCLSSSSIAATFSDTFSDCCALAALASMLAAISSMALLTSSALLACELAPSAIMRLECSISRPLFCSSAVALANEAISSENFACRSSANCASCPPSSFRLRSLASSPLSDMRSPSRIRVKNSSSFL